MFSYDQLEINRIRIQDFLNPIQGINAYFLEYDQSILKLNISNLQRLPIEILGLELQNGYKIFLKNSIFIPGKKPQSPVKNNVIKIDCLFKEDCKKLLISNQKIMFKILSQKKPKKANISMFYFKSE